MAQATAHTRDTTQARSRARAEPDRTTRTRRPRRRETAARLAESVSVARRVCHEENASRTARPSRLLSLPTALSAARPRLESPLGATPFTSHETCTCTTRAAPHQLPKLCTLTPFSALPRGAARRRHRPRVLGPRLSSHVLSCAPAAYERSALGPQGTGREHRHLALSWPVVAQLAACSPHLRPAPHRCPPVP